MVRTFLLALVAGLLVACTFAADNNDLSINIRALTKNYNDKARGNLLIKFDLTTAAGVKNTRSVLRFRTPLYGYLTDDSFEITDPAGNIVPYVGPHYKWASPKPEYFEDVKPGQMNSRVIDISQY
eukprot:Colp12_sorted_trinity150504_noHs@2468